MAEVLADVHNRPLVSGLKLRVWGRTADGDLADRVPRTTRTTVADVAHDAAARRRRRAGGASRGGSSDDSGWAASPAASTPTAPQGLAAAGRARGPAGSSYSSTAVSGCVRPSPACIGRRPARRSIVIACTHDSARSQRAAALWTGRHPLAAASAGTRPAERVPPPARLVPLLAPPHAPPASAAMEDA